MRPTLAVFLVNFLILRPLIFCAGESCAQSYLPAANSKLSEIYDQLEVAWFNFSTNMTNETEEAYNRIAYKQANCQKEVREALNFANWTNFRDPEIRRQIQLFNIIENEILSHDKLIAFTDIIGEMIEIYSSCQIKDFYNETKLLTREDASQIFKMSVNPSQLTYIWQQFADALGPKILKLYPNYVELKNEVAELHGFPDATLFWAEDHDPKFHGIVEKLMKQVGGFYRQLHAFVRFKLEKFYKFIHKNGCIPIHILGDMTAEDWQWITRRTLPYPQKEMLYTDFLKTFSRSRLELYKMTDDFFSSMSMPRLPASTWEKSIFLKPQDREVCCQPAIFVPFKDYRIVDCQSPEDLSSIFTANWAVSFLQLYVNAEKQPFIFRNDLYPTVAYGLGYLLDLSTISRKYLKYMTELEKGKDNKTGKVLNTGKVLKAGNSLNVEKPSDLEISYEDVINHLFCSTLQFLPLIPNVYVMEEWRKRVVTKVISVDNYNSEWWKLMHEYMGVEPPLNRSINDFDPSFHMSVIDDQIGSVKFMGNILSHQLHKHLCIKVGQYNPGEERKPLHECCLYGEELAGKLLVKGLSAGKSKPWTYLLEVVGGSGEVDAGAFLEYYKPLRQWLVKENEKNGVFVGWEKPRTYVTDSEDENNGQIRDL